MIAKLTKEEAKKVLQPSGIFGCAEAALRSREITKAIEFYHLAESEGYDPDSCAAGRWLCHALAGNFEAAWRESDAIQARGKPDANRYWDGSPLDGRRVLVRCLHGLGDTIHFVRYLPLLRERAASVTLEAQPALKELLQCSSLADKVITWGEPEGPWDQQIEIVELPRIFRTTLETIPARIPYLKTGSPARNDVSRELRAGLVWGSSRYDATRSLPLARLAPLLRIPGVRFYSFQAGAEREELRAFSPLIVDCYHPSGCVLTAARRLLKMHLLITVDTMMAHLGGALGLPVWTVLPAQADWRWMLDRLDSPWYPTMRLFRQRLPGDWDPVVEELKKQLRLDTALSEP